MKTQLRFATLALLSLALCSCIGQLVDAMGPKPAYSGPKPPSVVSALQAKTGSAKWLTLDPYALPASSELSKTKLKYASDGLPYGIESPYRNCVHSPYTPFPRLDTTGAAPQQIVYDPYTRKPFRLP